MLNLQRSASSGVVSALSGRIEAEDGKERLSIQGMRVSIDGAEQTRRCFGRGY
jgi:hypothetical protein